MLAAFDAPVEWTETTTEMRGPVATLRAPSDPIEVPGDFSAAANLIAAGIVVHDSVVAIEGVGANPGRTGFVDILRSMGAELELIPLTESLGEPVASYRVRSGCLVGADVGGGLVPRSVDELPLVAVLGCAARGVTSVHDAQELRLKESDRLAAIAEGLRKMGARVQERADGIAVWGPSKLRGTAVDGYGDHRIVMALAVAGLIADGETRIRGAECIGDSFPGFVDELAGLGADVRVERAAA
jgi:3-phosphoshikimate 1-carboxyvinyltransferase